MKRFPLAAFLSLVVLAVPTPAQAEHSHDPAAAMVLFKQGREALNQGRYMLACSKFRESQRLDPGAGTLMNLATCEEKLGKFASAWQHWQEAIDLMPSDDERLAFAKRKRNRVKGKVPRLKIQISQSAPKGTVVLKDGIELQRPSLGVALPVDPGKHVILVQTPGYAERRYEVKLAVAESKRLVVSSGDKLLGVVQDPDAGRRTVGWVVGGIGVAGLGGAALTSMLLDSRQNTVDENCEKGLCNQEGLDAAEDGKALVIANTALWGVAVAGLAGGAYLVLSSDSEERPRREVGVRRVNGGLGLSYRESF